MPSRIEDYALLSDLESAALVGRDGSIDWLTFPRFDSPACFAALLGTEENGRWLLAPDGGGQVTSRRYRDHSLVLETVWQTDDGEVAVVDCMPPRDDHLEVIRLVEGRRGCVRMQLELVVRFDYGWIVPWVRKDEGGLLLVAGPDSLRLESPVPVSGLNLTSVAHFSVAEGEVVPFRLSWSPAHTRMVPVEDPREAVANAERWWHRWASRMTYRGRWADDVASSLVVLKGLTYAPTGGIAAAPTTSLPEQLGGPRNWDYRYCWLRDATFSLLALVGAGYDDEAAAFRDWLLRAVAGDPARLQIMYGLAGERRLDEHELNWLDGYEQSRPVRVGNAATRQYQLDVYGEVMDAEYQSTLAGIRANGAVWDLQRLLVEFLESGWKEPDEGIWEVRGPRRHFTHSKVMAWVALDRAVRTAMLRSDIAPVDLERWRHVRDDIHRWVLEHCVDQRGRLVQHPDTDELDASLLMVPLVGFLPADDARVRATVEGIERELTRDGFVMRYRTRAELDGMPEGEGSFVMCSFWLAQVYALQGRTDDAVAQFERLLALRNDVGLLSEEYDPQLGRMLGNFPQAFSHTALVNTAVTINAALDGERGVTAREAATLRRLH